MTGIGGTPARIDEDVRLPNGVVVRIRPSEPADRSAIEALATAEDGVGIGEAADAASTLLVAKQPWTGELVGCGGLRRLAGARAAAAVVTARPYARTPLAAHLLVRLARLADEALLPTLVVGALDPAASADRFVRSVFALDAGDTEARTSDWQEAMARVHRLDRRPGGAAHREAAERPGVVIAGGGVAALECLMALRDLAGPELPIRLVAPGDDFVDRPAGVAEPFALGAERRHSLAAVADDFGATVVRGAVAEVRPDSRTVVTDAGVALSYDALVLALGAQPVAAYPAAITVGAPGAAPAIRALLDGIDGREIAFVVPGETTWTLPLYETALMSARDVRVARGLEARFWLVTPEARPLAVFGPSVSAHIEELLSAARVDFVGSTYAEQAADGLALEPGGRRLAVDAVVALPKLRGEPPAGVPANAEGFVATDGHGRVAGLEDVYAAGDLTTFPVKQGGIAAQQADAVAEAVAARMGAPLRPRPFKPVLRGLLYTGGDDRFMRAGIGGGEGDAAMGTGALWWPPSKVAGLYLAPYLFERDQRATVAPGGFTEVAVPLAR